MLRRKPIKTHLLILKRLTNNNRKLQIHISTYLEKRKKSILIKHIQKII